MRTVIVRELVRDKFDQIWISAPFGEGPGAGSSGGGQINGDTSGKGGGVLGTNPSGRNAGSGGLRGRTAIPCFFEESHDDDQSHDR